MFRMTRRNRKAIPDDVLLQQYRNTGDIELLGELFSRYMHLVYGVSLKYLKNREDAKDAVLGVFEKLVIEYKIYEIRNLKSWMYVLTKNFCLMELRKKKAQGIRLKEWQDLQPEFMESPVDLHPIDGRDPKINEDLKRCMEELKIEQKECIRLFYYDNRSYREIASALHLDEKKVKSHLQNGKRNLKICLDQKNAGKKEIR